MKLQSLLPFIGVFLAVCTHAASGQAPHTDSTPSQQSWADLVRRLEATERAYEEMSGRLNSAEEEVRQLRQWEAERRRIFGHDLGEGGSPSPRVDGGVIPADGDLLPHSLQEIDPVSCQESCVPNTPCMECPDCGKSVSEGQPHICGFSLDELSWNKAGGWKVVPFGRLRGEVIYSTAPYTNDVITAFLNPNNPGVDEDSVSVSGKQSQINFAITGPEMCGFQTGGLVLMNFMGSQPLRNFSGVNLVNAYGELKNDEWRFAFGRMLDLFGPISPSTVNQIAQRGAGNIGIYRGALHVDRYLPVGDHGKWTFSGRISQQDIADYAAVPSIRGTNAGWPNIEARIGWQLLPVCEGGDSCEIGVSGVIGEVQAVADQVLLDGIILRAEDEVAQTRGVALDVRADGEIFGARGEVWWGQAAGTYFVAALQSLNPNTAQAIESVGGWGEVYCRLTPRVTTAVGYGIDDPRNGDLGIVNPNVSAGQISLNDVGWWNVIWNVTNSFQLAFEVSHRRTRFLDPTAANEGTLFHFASGLTY